MEDCVVKGNARAARKCRRAKRCVYVYVCVCVCVWAHARATKRAQTVP